MKGKPVHIVLVLWCVLLLHGKVRAQQPDFRMACTHLNTRDIVLNWLPLNDPCGTFQSVQIFGRFDQSNPFQFIDSLNNISQLTYVHLNAALTSNKWEYFLVYKYGCGADSSFSDTLFTDIVQPPNTEIDSVSIDPVSGLPIIGWTSNSAKDLKGYIVWRTQGVNNVPLDSVFALSYTDSNASLSSSIGYRISAFDSCINQSVISAEHRTIHLTHQIDSCTGNVVFNWTNYQGRPVSAFDVYIRKNDEEFKIDTSIAVGNNTHNRNFQHGDSLEVFIRAKGSGFSSRSNSIKFSLHSNIKLSVNYVIQATNNLNDVIEINSLYDNTPLFNTLYLVFSSDRGQTYDTLVKHTITASRSNLDYTAKDLDNRQLYYFKQLVRDQCGALHHSNLSGNIVLNISGFDETSVELNWNPYQDWDAGLGNYEIYRGALEVPRETWSLINVSLDTSFTDYISETYPYSSICYYIKAKEAGENSYGETGYSNSNISCVPENAVIYMPNAITPNGNNPTFQPKGRGLNLPKSNIRIYNRYGQLVHNAPLNNYWDGTDLNKNPVTEGAYIYTAEIFSVDGVRQILHGTITVLY